MIKFYGYNDARAIAAYNKSSLTKMFLWVALICIIVSLVAILVPLYELLYVWGVYIFIILICLFAMSFSKYDDKVLKEKGIKTKHLFIIDDFKLYKDGIEIKNKYQIKFYVYKKYIFLELKKSYFYIPNEELNITSKELAKKLREVIYGTSVENIIIDLKSYISQNNFKGKFEFVDDTIIWYLGKNKFIYYIDLHEVYVNHDKLRLNKSYSSYTHYHINFKDIYNQMIDFNDKWGK